jgi:hypothetical protein
VRAVPLATLSSFSHFPHLLWLLASPRGGKVWRVKSVTRHCTLAVKMAKTMWTRFYFVLFMQYLNGFEASISVASTGLEPHVNQYLCTSMRWGPQHFNLTGKLVYVGNKGCGLKPVLNVTARIVLIQGGSGCTFETIARNMQPWKPRALIFSQPESTFRVPGIQAFVSDGSSTIHITVPAVSVTVPSFLALARITAASGHNESSVQLFPDENTFRSMFSSITFLMCQLLFMVANVLLYSWVLWRLRLWIQIGARSVFVFISLSSTGIRALCNHTFLFE